MTIYTTLKNLAHKPIKALWRRNERMVKPYLKRVKPFVPGRILSLISILLLVGCQTKVPKEQTSLLNDPGPNPGKPKKTLTMNWHHHSTGNRILDGGLRQALKDNNIEFYDIDHLEAPIDGYVLGEFTDPPDFPKNFNTPKYFHLIKTWELKGEKKQHDIIMFKSCYPASNIESEKMIEEYKGYYNSMLETFKNNPDILFIAMSTPPLMKARTNPENAKRARAWSKWITTQYAKDLKNVAVFDIFDALAIKEGFPDENTLVPQFGTAERDSHPSPEGGAAVTRLFIPWFNRVLKESGFGN